jgi:hypothetical protein
LHETTKAHLNFHKSRNGSDFELFQYISVASRTEVPPIIILNFVIGSANLFIDSSGSAFIRWQRRKIFASLLLVRHCEREKIWAFREVRGENTISMGFRMRIVMRGRQVAMTKPQFECVE